MKKIACIIACLSLAGCVALQSKYDKARDEFCKNKDALIAAAIAANDTRAINAIDAYCAPLPVQGL